MTDLASAWPYVEFVAIVWAAVAVITNLQAINEHLSDLRVMAKVRHQSIHPSDERDLLKGIYTHLKYGGDEAGDDVLGSTPLVSILKELQRLNERLDGRL